MREGDQEGITSPVEPGSAKPRRIDQLSDLLARVETASGADRRLDMDLALAFTPGAHGYHDHGFMTLPGGATAEPDYLTASLDAALALCERVLPGWYRFVGDLDPTDPRAVATVAEGLVGSRSERGFAPPKQYALAMCAAILRALIAQEEASNA